MAESAEKILYFPDPEKKLSFTEDELQDIIANAIRQNEDLKKKSKTKPKPRTQSRFTSRGVRKAHAAEPLYSPEEFNRLAQALKDDPKNGARNFMLLVFGCTIGDRGGDIIKARICDVVNSDGTIRDYYECYEQKTGKLNKNKITPMCKDAISEYLKTIPNYKMDDYLIHSRKGGGITRTRMYQILNEGAKKAGLSQNIGTHTLRKTYGYMARKANSSDSVMDTLQAKYKHSDQRTTKTYLTITQEEIDDLAESVDEILTKTENQKGD